MQPAADRRGRWWPWGVTVITLVAALAAGGGWWWFGRPSQGAGKGAQDSRQAASLDPARQGGRGSESTAQTEFRQSLLTGWYQGQKQWELHARVVQVAEDGLHTRLEQVREGVLYRHGRPYLGFQSGTGVWDQGTGDLDLSGGVQVTYQGRTVFQTERVQWLAASGRLLVPGRVELDWQGRHLQADRLEGDLSRQVLTAQGHVVIKEGGQTLAAERVEMDLAQRTIRAQGSARLELELAP
ncbi:MAG: LPS export ABC transporter periplasmic protein LptC [Limnochordaceae bacterium]|nr:LPS export ABC transporter periplasmic protein LptC [Limnochordaceae bacterium]